MYSNYLLINYLCVGDEACHSLQESDVKYYLFGLQFSCSVMSVIFATSWTAACQASLSITNSRSLLKLMSIKPVTSSNQLFLCRPLLLLPSIFPRIRIFSSESALHIRWPKYWSFSCRCWFDLLAVQGTLPIKQ